MPDVSSVAAVTRSRPSCSPPAAAADRSTAILVPFVTRAGADFKPRRQAVPIQRQQQLLPDVPAPAMVDDVFADAAGGRLQRPAHLGLPRHRQRRRHELRAPQGERRLLPVLGRHPAGLQRRRRRAAAPRLRAGRGRAGRHQAGHPADQQLERVRWHGPVRALARRAVPRRLLHRPGDPRLVQGLDQPRPQPGQQPHRRGVQGRPDRHGLGTGQRAALRRIRGLPAVGRPAPTPTITDWAADISAPHQVASTATTWSASGDEGFLCTDPRRQRLDLQLRRTASTPSRWPNCPQWT